MSRIKFPEDLSGEELSQYRELIDHNRDIFSTSDTDIGTTDKVRHHIELSIATFFKQKYRQIPPALIDEVCIHVKDYLAGGIIRPSHSPFSSNVVLVRRADGSLRLCIDYRQ